MTSTGGSGGPAGPGRPGGTGPGATGGTGGTGESGGTGEPRGPAAARTDALRAIEEVACAPPSLLLEICVDRAGAIAGATGAAVGMAQEGELFFTASAGVLRGRIGGSQPVAGSLGGLALSSGETLHASDAQRDERCAHERARRLGIGSLVVTPLTQGRRRAGVLFVCSQEAGAFDDAAVDLVARIGRVVSARLDYAQVRDERRRSEQSLVETRLQLSALLTSLDEGVLLLDAARRVVQANPAAERLLGIPRERLMASNAVAAAAREAVLREDGRTWPPEEQPAVVALRTGEPQRDQIMGMQLDDGSVRWLRVTAQPIFDSSGDALLGVAVAMSDITRLRDREERLERCQRLQDHTERLVPAGTWDWRAGSHLVAWSPGMFRLLGRDPQDTPATFETYLNAAHPDDRPAVRETVLSALRNGGAYAIEHRVVRPDGEARRVRASGEVAQSHGRTTRGWGCLYDVTDLVAAEPEPRPGHEPEPRPEPEPQPQPQPEPQPEQEPEQEPERPGGGGDRWRVDPDGGPTAG